jgi:hypothetical protein
MTQLGGRHWSQMWTAVSSALVSAVPPEVRAEPHLATEAVVAYVDGELSIAAHERATRHLASCTMCTAEVAAQRQARAAVRNAQAPTMPPTLLAALHAIPHTVDLPLTPPGLVVDDDGEFMMAQRPLGSGSLPLGASAPLGSGRRLGAPEPEPAPSDEPDASSRRASVSRRAVQGAGVVVSGLVLGALALAAAVEPTTGGTPRPGAESGSPVSVVPARLELDPRSRDAGAKPIIVPALAQR